MVQNILIFAGGVGILCLGAEWLVRGSARLATALKVSPIIIGLTIVSLGTSAPELVVSVIAAIGGSGDLAIGNVMGSNLANIGLVLGLSAILRPIEVSRRVGSLDIPMMILITALLLPIIWDLRIERSEGFILLAILSGYLYLLFRREIKESEKEHLGLESHTKLQNFTLIAIGATGLIVGAFAIRESALLIARTMGISELVIGLTIVSVGTSLPELATSIVAAFRDKADIAVGNIIGSNIFNILAVLGFTGMIVPLNVNPHVLIFEFPAVIIMSILLLPVVWMNFRIKRLEGIVLLGSYLALGAWIVL